MLTIGHTRGSHSMRIVGFMSTTLLIFLLLGILFPISFKNKNTEAASSYTAPTLDYNSTNNTATVNLTIADVSGTFATSSIQESASFSISTNNTTGYTVNLKTTGNVTSLSDGTNNIASIETAKTSANFTTNTWGLMPSKYNGTVNTTNYYPASASGFNLDETSTANSTANTYTVGLGVKADYGVPAGTYTNNTIIVEYVANPVSYNLSYNKNVPVAEESTVTNMPTSQSGTGSLQYVALSSNIPARPHYNFLGWCDGTITTTNHQITDATIDTCTGASSSTGLTATTYQPGDNFYFNTTTNNAVTLYAMWEKRYYMQDFIPEMCTSMTVNTNLVLYDNRDETDYKIGKLADESCWTLDNLALDLTDSAVQANLSNATTNASNTSLGYLKGNTSRDPVTDPDGNYATSGVTVNWNNSYSYSVPQIYLEDKDIIPSGAPVNSVGKNKIGGYYNFCAATAGSYCYGDGLDYGNPTSEASEDICPKNWRIPSGGTVGEYQNLSSEITGNSGTLNGGDANSVREALSTPLSGIYFEGSSDGQNTYGMFWSYTKIDYNLTYILYVESSNVDPLDYYGRGGGRSIRCVLKYPYMQDQTESTMAEMLPNIGDTTVLADKRDNIKYMVGRLADDNYWMLKNLALDIESAPLAVLQGNTNASDTTLNYLKNGGGTNPYSTTSVSTTWSDSYNMPMINTTKKYTLATSYGVASIDGKAKVGIYYNYCAASAGSYCASPAVVVDEINEDICPAGWRMPTAKPIFGEYRQLCSAIKGEACTTGFDGEEMSPTNINSVQYQLSMPLSGAYKDNDNYEYFEECGTVWSSTFHTTGAMRFLGSCSEYVVTQASGSRFRGQSVRCILKSPIMQDQTTTSMATLLPNNGDSIKMEDKRDHSEYQVTKINGDYWMTQNLRIAGTVSSKDSNFTGNSINTSVADLTTGNSFTEPRTHIGLDSDNNYTVWYNFCSASAETICDNTTTSDATNDICPLGWHLPLTSEMNNFDDYKTIFNPTTGGYYDDGQLINPSYGRWWSASVVNGTYQYGLDYQQNLGIFGNYKSRGFYVRCIREFRTILDIEYMQELTPSIAHNTPIGTTTTLKDNRDEQGYTVSKLADGNIWMLDNIALDLTNQTIVNGINSSNTNASATSLNYLKNGGGTTSDQYATAGLSYSEWTSGGSYSAPLINTLSKNTTYTNDSLSADARTWKYGIYYNFCAASAGSYCYGDGNSSGTSLGDSTEDICPKGWHIPSGGTNGDYGVLYTNYYNSLSSIRNALHLPLSGWLSSGQNSAQGETGGWFSATRLSNANMYGIHIESSGVTVTRTPGRAHGNTFRCIADY